MKVDPMRTSMARALIPKWPADSYSTKQGKSAREIGHGRTGAFVAGTLKEEAIVLALKAMSLLNADDAPKVELLADRDQCQTYKVCADGRALLVRLSNKGSCAAAHFYATTAARHDPDFWPKVLGHDAERGILVEEWLDPGEYKSLAQELLQEPGSYGWSTPFREGEFSQIDFESPLYGVGEKIGKIHTRDKGLRAIWERRQGAGNASWAARNILACGKCSSAPGEPPARHRRAKCVR